MRTSSQRRDPAWPRSCSARPGPRRALGDSAHEPAPAHSEELHAAEAEPDPLGEAARPHMSLRTRILGAILGAVAVAVIVTTWVINDCIVDGATREAQRQAHERGMLTTSLYAERAQTLVANA